MDFDGPVLQVFDSFFLHVAVVTTSLLVVGPSTSTKFTTTSILELFYIDTIEVVKYRPGVMMRSPHLQVSSMIQHTTNLSKSMLRPPKKSPVSGILTCCVLNDFFM